MGMRQLKLGALWAAGRKRRDAYRDGMLAYNRGDWSDAIARLSQLAEDDSLHGRLSRFYIAQAHRTLGLTALEHGQFADAVGQLQSACRYNPAGGDLARYLAVAYARAGRGELVAGPLERAIQVESSDTRARVMLAISQWRNGQHEAAELTLHQGLGPDGESAEILFHLALLCAQRDQWARVESLLTRCVASDDRRADAWRYLGLACGAQDRPADAVEHLKRAARLSPSDPHVALELAYAAIAAGQQQAAPRLKLVDLTSPVEASDPSDLDCLASAIIAEPEFIQAFLDLEPSPADQQIFGVLGFSLDRAVAARPTYADLHYYVSKVNRRLGRISDAIDSAEQAIALNPRYVSALIQAAALYRQTAQRGTAADRLRAALAAGGDYPDVHLLLGELYQELGQVQRARESYQRALHLKPDYEPAARALNALAA